jgi:energy-coupling factor transporter ATP-binding protein EcfA2
MAQMARIFISYARKDGSNLAQKLQTDLIKCGHEVWLDKSDIAPGTDWSQEIEQAIESCNVAIALISEGAFASKICRSEHLLCLDKGKQIIPVLVQSDTPRPLYLYTLNYLDFSAQDNYETQFKTLLEQIESEKPTEIRETPRYPSDSIVAKKFIENARNLVRQKILFSDYRQDDYVPRSKQAVVQDFIASDKAGMVLVGHSGMGKTTLLLHLAATYLENYVCLLLNAHALAADAGALQDAIIAHFKPANEAESLTDLSHYFTAIRTACDQPILILLDGVNEHENPELLLRNLNQFLIDYRAFKIKAIITSQTSTWQIIWGKLRLTQQLPVSLYYGLETARDLARGFSNHLELTPYDDQELEFAYRRLNLKPAWEQVKDTYQVLEWLRDPLLLWIIAEVYSADTDSVIPDRFLSSDVMLKYLNHVNMQTGQPDESDQILMTITERMHQTHQQTLSEKMLQQLGIPIGPKTTLGRLIDMGILEVISTNGSNELRFSKERFFEFLLYRRLSSTIRLQDLTSEKVADLVAEAYDYTFVWGALEYWFTREWPGSLLRQLAQYPSMYVRNFLVELCQTKSRESHDAVSHILLQGLQDTKLEAKQFAVIAAFACDDQPVLEKALLDTDAHIQLLAAEYLGYLYETDPDDALEVLKSLALQVPKGLLGTIRNLDLVSSMIYLTILLGPKYLTDRDHVRQIIDIWMSLGRQILPRVIFTPSHDKPVKQFAKNFIISLIERTILNGLQHNEGGWIDGIALKEFYDFPPEVRHLGANLAPYMRGDPLDQRGQDVIFQLAQYDNGVFFSAVRMTIATQGFFHWDTLEDLILRIFSDGNSVSRGCVIAGLGICLLDEEWVTQDKLDFFMGLTLNYMRHAPYGQLTFNGRYKPGWVVYYTGLAAYQYDQIDDSYQLIADFLKDTLGQAKDPAYFDDVADELALLAVDTELFFVFSILNDLFAHSANDDLSLSPIYSMIMRTLSQLYMKYPNEVANFVAVLADHPSLQLNRILMDLRKYEQHIYGINLMASRFEHFIADVLKNYPNLRTSLFVSILQTYPAIKTYSEAVHTLVSDVVVMMENILKQRK